jgi:putative ABC transport system permease protein
MRQDLWWAVRWVRKNPFFSAAVVFILALGIGVNSAVFSIVDAVLLRPSPFPGTERLMRVEERVTSGKWAGVPIKDYQRWAGRNDIFERVAAYLRDTVTLTGGGEPEQVIAVRTLGLFPVLGAHAQLGRSLIASDNEGGAQLVVAIDDRLWRRRYHADPGVIGRAITISGDDYTIVGVMRPDFEFHYSEADLWTPLRLTATTPWLQVIARLRRGVSVAQARSALEIVSHRMEQEEPKDRAGLKILVRQWRDTPDEKYTLTLLFVLVAVGLMMLIVCADVGGLLLTRAVEREKEITIRASLGAGLWRIVRQLLSESLVLAIFGSVGGIVMARLLLQLLTKELKQLPIVLPHLQQVGINGRVLVFNTILCLLLAILCSLAPILLAARTDLPVVLRSGSANTRPGASSRLFSTIIGLETGFAFLLLVGSGLMIRSLIRVQQEDHGFQSDRVLTLRVPVGTATQPRPTGKYDTRPRQMAYYRDILQRVKSVPGVKAAAIVNNPPLSDVNTSLSFGFAGPDGKPQETSARTISSDYFAAMGIPLMAGRTFNDSDRAGAAEVAIINESLARQLFPNRNPLNRKLISASKASGPTIVGVVKDFKQRSYELPATGEVYIPYQQYIFATFMSTIVVRTDGEPTALASALQKQVWAVDPNQPVVKVETMHELIANSIWRPRFSAWIFSVLSGLSLLLTASGVYGVIAYTSALRAREIGIRVALGATASNVAAMILYRAMIPLMCGLSLSVVAALLLSRLLTSLLYGISSSDFVTYCSAAALLLITGMIASARPAWQAATRDPLQTLRAE